jgi:MYXO-CTERM domain-containing protein
VAAIRGDVFVPFLLRFFLTSICRHRRCLFDAPSAGPLRSSTGNHLYNNILFHAGARGAVDISADSLTGLVSNHNVVTDRFVIDEGSFISLAAWRTMTGQDTDSVAGTAADTFVDPAGGNYRPKPAGPAAGRGDAAQAPPADIEGTPRTPPVEAGAYELGGPPPVDAGPGTPDARPAADAPPGTPDARPMPDAAPGTADARPIPDATPMPDDAPGAPDAAAGADAPSGSPGAVTGCSCRTSAGGSSPSALAVAAIAVIALRRRRRS